MADTSRPADEPLTDAVLENTYWKLTHLRSRAIDVAGLHAEPHLILHSDGRRVFGSGGCNQFVGRYAAEEDRLSLGRLTRTHRLCLRGTDQEAAFLAALPSITRWHIQTKTLLVFDSLGDPVAQFESRPRR